MTSGVTADDPLSPQGPPVAIDACTQKKINENNRRCNKPIMEKKRRARINNCLNELKTLILDATKKDPARHSKLEKADILEMTVKHLESMQRNGVALSAATGSTVANKFKAGFTECTNEVNRFPGLEPHVRRRLMQHLGAYFNKDCGAAAATAAAAVAGGCRATTPPPETSDLRLRLDASGHNAILQLGAAAAGSARGVQLVPTRLPNGDIALVLPSRPPASAAAAAETSSTPPPPPPPIVSVAPATPPSTQSDSSGTESPTPDRPSSCFSAGSCDSADTYGRPEPPPPPPLLLPLALVTKHHRGRRDDVQHSDLEQPWRPW